MAFSALPSAAMSRLKSAVEALSLGARHGFPRRLVRFHGGIGDHLLCTALGREWRKRGEKGVWMMSDHAELFAGNPDFEAVVPEDMRLLRIAQRLNIPVIDPTYAPVNFETDRQQALDCHFITRMCQIAGMSGEVDLRAYVHLTGSELAEGAVVERQIAIMSTGRHARYPALTKEWYPERFQEVVTRLRGEFNFVQLGTPSDPLLEGAVDLRGKTTLRQGAAILARSRLFIGLAGFLMHLARSVECPAVIVYGGRELPSVSGYRCNENLYTPIECSPCWLLNSCPYDRECMKRIGVEEVVAAAHRQLARGEAPLSVDRAFVT
jgi:hypothetical protein